MEKAVSTISHVNDLIVTQATNIRDFSWYTANQILDTHYGTVAVKRLDNTAVIIDQLIDKYFPATVEEKTLGETSFHTITIYKATINLFYSDVL